MAFDTVSSTDTRRGLPLQPYYWTSELLSSFTFLMAGHAAPVCASMMLGDASYARDQLRLACTFDDQALQQVAVEMLNGFGHQSPESVDSARWSH